MVDTQEMAAVMNPAADAVTPTQDDRAQVALLRDDAAFNLARDPELERWIAAVHRQVNVACAALSLADGARQIIRVVGESPTSPKLVDELTSSVSLGDYLLGPTVAAADEAREAFAEVPVVLAGKVIGHLAIVDPRRATWSVEDLSILCDTASAVATELERRLARAEVVRVQELVTSHNRVHDMIGNGAPLREVLIEVCRIIERYDPSFIPSVLLRDPESNTLHSGIGPSLPKQYLDSVDGAPIGPSVGTCGPAAWFGELAVSADLSKDPKWAPIRAMAELAGVAHCWSMPIKDPAGEVLGTLALYGRRPRLPQPEHVALLRDWARVAGTALERTRSIARLRHDARHDSLTGLPNRAAIFEKLDSAIEKVRTETPLAVFFVDLDGLKALNDTLGHDVADEMIREVAQRHLSTVREGDFVGRFGGDEFIVVAENIGDPTEAGHLGERLLSAIAQPLPGLGARVITASIGIALIRTSGIEAREALRRSDAAMYEAKRTGRDRCVFAEVGETVRAGRRLELARALQGAEARGEMRLVYQPVISLPSRQIIGVEALLRWNSPTLGEVQPSEFIPIAEDTGSILQIGAWVLWESCDALASLALAGHRLELGVNVSARQLSQPDFPLWVRQTLSHAQFSPAMLSLELTETSLLRPDSVSVGNVRSLEKMGVRVALDDFGTGYSSLTWLRDHPFGSIKIDRSFVAGIHEQDSNRAIVSAIIRLAKDVGCTVTAEGVETEAQLRILESLGCDHAQGFLIAYPESIPALLIRLGAQPPKVTP
ncbi:MAG: EAL domain-containing protein [Steroidobacteraceae bacterium]